MSVNKIGTFRKAKNCPNAFSLGYTKHSVAPGDLIAYRLGESTALGRVLGLVHSDGTGAEYDEPRLLVLTTNTMLTHGWEMHVRLEDVIEVRAQEPKPFAVWFLTGEVPTNLKGIYALLDLIHYGGTTDKYFREYLDEESKFDICWRRKKGV